MAKKSNAFQAFCKDAFGEDFSQDGFSNIEQIDMILQYIPQKDNVHILDIGCGNGKMLGYLQEKTKTYIHGFDYSEEAIKTAKLLFPKNSEFREGIIGEIDYPEENLEHMWKGILREENEQPLLPNSKNGIPDAKNTWNIMMQAPILITILNTNGKSPINEIDTDNRFTEICDTLSIGASIENMLLKATEIGLGWGRYRLQTCILQPQSVTKCKAKM